MGSNGKELIQKHQMPPLLLGTKSTSMCLGAQDNTFSSNQAVADRKTRIGLVEIGLKLPTPPKVNQEYESLPFPHPISFNFLLKLQHKTRELARLQALQGVVSFI